MRILGHNEYELPYSDSRKILASLKQKGKIITILDTYSKNMPLYRDTLIAGTVPHKEAEQWAMNHNTKKE
ncbi:hypothetical protein ACFQ1H_00285 [Scardovia wiggsiae]|jgi:hypothetical protein|uniref:hypothetical protein n=1 Tax=Scardovia wiggsiae TaxID=230143 RepID=UPI00362C9D49